MAGSAILGSNLVDDLVPTIDELRGDLYPDMGIRASRVYLVTRTWSGLNRNEGTATLAELEITPQPKIEASQDMADVIRYFTEPSGRQEDGEVMVSEVSLTYTEAELTGGAIPKNKEFYYRIVEANGQAARTRYFVLARPPLCDREKTLGWVLRLKRAEVQE